MKLHSGAPVQCGLGMALGAARRLRLREHVCAFTVGRYDAWFLRRLWTRSPARWLSAS